jgi:hypothetical protein
MNAILFYALFFAFVVLPLSILKAAGRPTPAPKAPKKGSAK